MTVQYCARTGGQASQVKLLSRVFSLVATLDTTLDDEGGSSRGVGVSPGERGILVQVAHYRNKGELLCTTSAFPKRMRSMECGGKTPLSVKVLMS